MTDPLVSIICTTFNQEQYIGQAIEGFLLQKTNFPIEIIIHDDCSTDNNQKIIQSYADKTPDLFKLIFQTENQYSKGRKNIISTLPTCKGKYIAICEGDDYWTDPYKLQKQVDFLEGHPDYVLALHNSLIHYETKEAEDKIAITRIKEDMELYDFIDLDYFHKEGGLISRGHTASIVFKNHILKEIPEWYLKGTSGDLYLLMLIAEHGKARFINETMSVYRVNNNGVTRKNPAHRGHALNNNRITMLHTINKHFGKRFDNLIQKQLTEFHFVELKSNLKEKMLLPAVKDTIKAVIHEKESKLQLLKQVLPIYKKYLYQTRAVQLYWKINNRFFWELSFRQDPNKFIKAMYRDDAYAYASVPDGKATLYGTCYALQAGYYLGNPLTLSEATRQFILNCQDPETGLFAGPELLNADFDARKHDTEHLLLHLTCTVLPVLQQSDIKAKYPIYAAHKFVEHKYLKNWLDSRDLTDAWLEGNNLLFIGQLLVYLRDEENYPGAAEALETWFSWLDDNIDPKTGLWGTNGQCSNFNAMYGGYHQLLVYYYEQRPVKYPEELIDTVLALQHNDGGFSESAGGGACEDIDAVDILVNLYKLTNYKRAQIRIALRRNLALLLSIQNEDGGFPYNRYAQTQSHMGIPDTTTGKAVSTMFATWFRVHTLALISEILTDIEVLKPYHFQFNSHLSMGWHQPWNKKPLSFVDRQLEFFYKIIKRFSK